MPFAIRHGDGAGGCGLVACAGVLLFIAGCLAPGSALSPSEREIAGAARAILTLDPNAVWTEQFNRLVGSGPASIDYLMRQPALTRPAAPDDLRVLLHTSLVRLLADPATAPPHLSASCLETSLGLLHFDLKVQGHALGTVVVTDPADVSAWHELYPAEFDHARAAQIDVEADRQAVCEWWRTRGAAGGVARRLEPQTAHLWRILERRFADTWEYQPEPRTILCATGQPGGTLLAIPTVDYNIVRAACIWLGRSADAAVERRLIESVGSPSPVVAHNARFALRFSRNPQIRAALERFDAKSRAGRGAK